MQVITDLDSFRAEIPSAVTLGKFDALHLGHQRLIRQVQRYGASGEERSVVFAFDMHRDTLLLPEEKRERLEGMVDILILCPFTHWIREMEAEDFVRGILVDRLRVRHITVGSGFRFGYEKKGDTELLARLAPLCGFGLDVVDKECLEGRTVSSSRIRECLRSGQMGTANLLLGYPYEIRGRVQEGNRIGRTLGFPTMNIAPAKRKIVPRFGVYTCRVFVNGAWYSGICNVGVKPTVEKKPVVLVESHVFDYEGDAYGQEIRVRFNQFLRPETRFAGLDALRTQLQKDLIQGREMA